MQSVRRSPVAKLVELRQGREASINNLSRIDSTTKLAHADTETSGRRQWTWSEPLTLCLLPTAYYCLPARLIECTQRLSARTRYPSLVLGPSTSQYDCSFSRPAIPSRNRSRLCLRHAQCTRSRRLPLPPPSSLLLPLDASLSINNHDAPRTRESW